MGKWFSVPSGLRVLTHHFSDISQDLNKGNLMNLEEKTSYEFWAGMKDILKVHLRAMQRVFSFPLLFPKVDSDNT